MKPLVSIIVPAYNAERYLRETLESALAQTHSDTEVIVVNDGSSDGTPDILRAYGAKLQVVDQQNRGLAAARNAGAAIARGEWLAFLDADDLWVPSKLEVQLEEAGDCALVYSDRLNIGHRGSFPELQSTIEEMFDGDVFERLLTYGNVLTASSVIVRTDVYRSLGGFEESLPAAEDWDLWIRVAERHRIKLCRLPLVHYRMHAESLSGNPMKMWSSRLSVLSRALHLQRARRLPVSTRRRIRAAMWATNGWDAGRRDLRLRAFQAYMTSAFWWPFSATPYKGAARVALGFAKEA